MNKAFDTLHCRVFNLVQRIQKVNLHHFPFNQLINMGQTLSQSYVHLKPIDQNDII
jgi:hypothetical protein